MIQTSTGIRWSAFPGCPVNHRHLALWGLLLGVLLSGVSAAAPSRSSRAAQIKARQEQAAYMQLEMVRYQSDMARINQEIYQSFDEDGDGTLKGPEKAKYDKHMRAIQSGKEPNPFAAILPVGQGPRPKSPMEELKKRAQEYQSDVVAKQQEIYSSFDANGNGNLEGPEKAKFDKYMRDVQSGKAPNPFAALAGGGPTSKK